MGPVGPFGFVCEYDVVSTSDRCAALVTETPKRLEWALAVPSGSSLPNGTTFFTREKPYILATDPGKEFGGPTHYDESCSGTLSYQLQGRKHWALWAPFPLG